MKPDVAGLGGFLRDRRARLVPDAGLAGRRRTPGLRREEVAARAGVSVTWYTWLEQGRGGPPSDEVLERLARALELDAAGREALFLLARQRPPPIEPAPSSPVTPAVQRVLDGLATSPAFVKTAAWDVVAWNAAACVVFGDYDAIPPAERNGLRRLFGDPAHRARLPDWEEIARFAAGVLRLDVTRGFPDAIALAAELLETSAEFRRVWAAGEVRTQGSGLKRMLLPGGGLVTFDYATFAVDGGPGLSMMVFSPLSETDARTIADLVARRAEQAATDPRAQAQAGSTQPFSS
ncbi:helix-turn-helix domain-containing protein [Rhizobiales bacterium Sp-1]|uniref:Helix-turn-helix domain-containing protein n=2 Tax=Segnochrobactrum spirostomi TaxID=2608987 RepID=A0A6A7Y5L3_9HYPH|nr:helix-turn-helix domain-containing protein [Segnochrobactrum spirostomi]